MTSGRYRIYIEKDPETGLLAARCLEMSVFSQGRDEREALRNIKAAIRLHLHTLEEEAANKKLLEVEI